MRGPVRPTRFHESNAPRTDELVPEQSKRRLPQEDPWTGDGVGRRKRESRWGGMEDIVVAGLLRRRGRALMVHRSSQRRWYPDAWDLPGGHVEVGEVPRLALVRELREELVANLPVPTPNTLQQRSHDQNCGSPTRGPSRRLIWSATTATRAGDSPAHRHVGADQVVPQRR